MHTTVNSLGRDFKSFHTLDTAADVSRSESRLVSLRGLPQRRAAGHRTPGRSRYGPMDVIRPAAEVRRVSEDPRRYVANASAHTNSMLQKMVSRLQTYRTFQPVITTQKTIYKQPGNSRENTVVVADPMEVIDRALDASNDFLLSHNIDDHFIATMVRTVGESTPRAQAPTWTTLIEQYQAQDSSDVDSTWNGQEAFLDAWNRDHPELSKEESRTQALAWRREQAGHDRSLRQKTLQDLFLETADLEAADASGRIAPTEDEVAGMDVEERMRWAMEQEASRLRDTQRETWAAFSRGEQTGRAEPARMPLFPTKIVSDYEQDKTVTAWITGNWMANTDRHEDAAVLIQKTYRGYLAKRIVAMKRYTRQLAFHECCRAEEKYIQQWNIAVALMYRQSALTQSDKRMRAVQFFLNCINAKVVARRARRQAEEAAHEEILQYAATTIQRVYRGYCGRERAKGIRDPELLVIKHRKRQEKAGICIQALWKGAFVRHRLAKSRRSACIIQRAYRSHAARMRVAMLRSNKGMATKVEVRDYSAIKIQRFFRHRRYLPKQE